MTSRLSRAAAACLGCLCAACLLVAVSSVSARAAAPASSPAADGTAAVAPALALQAGDLYVPATGQTLYAEHAGARRAIASTTKMMTALVTLQHVHDLATVFTYPDHRLAADDSQIGLRPGERMTVRDLVIAMMLPSADDAAWDLAYNVGHGSIARFIGWMNADARRLGLRGTHFSTPSGLDTPGNYSTAADLVRLAQYDLAHYPFFAQVVRMPSAHLSTGPESEVDNLNTLVGAVPWVIGVKTGHTADAGWLLVAAGQRDGLRLVGDVLGTPTDDDSDSEALALLQWGYANFRMVTPVHRHQTLARPTVKWRPGVHAVLRATRSWRRVLPRTASVHVAVHAPRQLTGPLPAGALVGVALVQSDGRTLARIPMVLASRLPAVSRLTIVGRFFSDRPWLVVLVALGLIALVLLAAFAVVRRGAGGPGGRGGGRGGYVRTRSDWERA